VINARNGAINGLAAAASDPGNAHAIHELMDAEGVLAGAMSKFSVVMEDYPDLKANQNMMQLSEELTATENKVSFARQAFNDAVMAYNTAREVFPNVIVANMFAFSKTQLLEIKAEEEKEAPKVSF